MVALIFIVYGLLVMLLAALPAAMVIRNLPLFYRVSQVAADMAAVPVSVLIPARDEELGIAAAVESVLRCDWPGLEVIVMDDHSSDRTAAIVTELAAGDARLRLATAPPLPADWNGKQHACWQLASLATTDWLLFMDADVRLQPHAIPRLVAEAQRSQVPLLSGFPNQETGTWSERLLIPMMHFVLLGYLPLDRMRASVQPEFGAGCGQLFLAQRGAYFACGGHQTIQNSRHDGLKLPRCFRAAGFASDVVDASDLATVRMYRGWREVARGLLKNADEGIASPRLIVIFSALLLGAGVLPLLSLGHALYHHWGWPATTLLAVATLLSYLPRALLAWRLQQSLLGVVLHPLAVGIFVALQWVAFFRLVTGSRAIAWRGRT